MIAPRREGERLVKMRPVSITVIAWILIVMAGISLLANAAMTGNPKVQEIMEKTPLPIPVQYAMMYAGLAVTIISAVGMLKGGNWARWLYVIWGAIGFAVGMATSPAKAMMIPGLIVFVVVVVFLFRPNANEFFAP